MEESKKFTFDDSVRYSREHTWARNEDNLVAVGISDFAQHQLGEIIFVELPEPDATFSQDEVFGVVESVKTASDLYMPLSGKVVEINDDLADAPELVNREPYKGGWMIKVAPDDPSEMDSLLFSKGYLEMIKPDASPDK